LAPESAALATGAKTSAPPIAAAANHGATRMIVLFMVSSIRPWKTAVLCAGIHSNLALAGSQAIRMADSGAPRCATWQREADPEASRRSRLAASVDLDAGRWFSTNGRTCRRSVGHPYAARLSVPGSRSPTRPRTIEFDRSEIYPKETPCPSTSAAAEKDC
jgi:hypothetical protein